MNVRLSFWVVWLVGMQSFISVDGQCARFTFPDLDSNVLTAAENTAVSLKFAIQEDSSTPGCFNNFGVFNVQVLKGVNLTLCTITYASGQFNPQGLSNCTPTSTPGVLLFTYTVNRTDDKQQLRWRSSKENVTSNRNITFNITYPAVILRFSVAGDENSNVTTVQQGKEISFGCAWKQGNPLSAGYIYRYRNNEKVELKQVEDKCTSNIHTSRPQCEDSGIYRCEVGDVSVNKTLLVQCPLTNLKASTSSLTVQEGSSADLLFTVHSYTREMASCRLKAVSSIPSAARNEDCGSPTVTGDPPDLTVSVKLDNVTTQDQGTWRLTLANDIGIGESLEFSLTVIEQTETNPLGGAGSPMSIFVAGGVGLVFAIIAVVIVVVIIIRRRRAGKAATATNVARNGRNASERGSEQPEMITNTLYGGSDDCAMIVNNMYGVSGGAPMTSESAYEDVGSGWQKPKPSTSKQGVVGDGDYAEVDTPKKKDWKKAKNSTGAAENATGDMYVDAADVRKNKGKGKQSKPRAANGGDAMGDMYVGADEVRAKKKEKKANDAMGDMYVGAEEVRAKKKDKKAKGGDAMGDMYVGAEEVRAKKKGKKGHGGNDPAVAQETAGAGGERSQNKDGLIYVGLDFGDQPSTSHPAPPPAEETEYAAISPNAVPPRPPR